MTGPTRQEVFDRVWTAFVVEKAPPSITSRCLYRGPRGAKCAVGLLIPDEMYDPRMEKVGVTTLCRLFPHLREHVGTDTLFLDALQSTHDFAATHTLSDAHFSEEVEVQLRKVAEVHRGLKVPS